ncbi:MAG: hypothetical protein M1815_001582 [Lichina confinis]|nr:MAG: hypothetical protein M1815_001582 [Lichina confinis]
MARPFQRSSYYNEDNRTGLSLLRARRPFLVKNAITGLSLFGMCVGIYAWTIHAIAQDDFEDVPIPDPPKTAQLLEAKKKE